MTNVIPKHMSVTSMSISYFKAKTCHRFWALNPKVCEDEEDIKGKLIIVTGSNTGIGKETVLHLATRGAHVIMACRDIERAQEALEDIKLKAPDSQIEIMKLDLGHLQSVRDFVKEFQSKYDKLDVLINNAGYYNTAKVRQVDKDGFEQHIGVNHLGPFLLTLLLIDSLKKGAPSRIVCVSSSLIVVSPLDLDDLMMEKRDLRTLESKEAYNRSKLANFICMKKFAEELKGSGVKLYQLNPGLVNTDITRYEEGFFNKMMVKIENGLFAINVTQGCETTIFCTVSKSIAEDGGKGEIYEFCQRLEYCDTMISMDDPKVKKLYEISEQLVGLKSEA